MYIEGDSAGKTQSEENKIREEKRGDRRERERKRKIDRE